MDRIEESIKKVEKKCDSLLQLHEGAKLEVSFTLFCPLAIRACVRLCNLVETFIFVLRYNNGRCIIIAVILPHKYGLIVEKVNNAMIELCENAGKKKLLESTLIYQL